MVKFILLIWRNFGAEYGMAVVLLLLCVYYSVVTLQEQQPRGAEAGVALAREIQSSASKPANVLIIAAGSDEDRAFADALETKLIAAGVTVSGKVLGEPRAAKAEMKRLAGAGVKLAAIATTPDCAAWTIYNEMLPALGNPPIRTAPGYKWPTFLKGENLLNVANQITIVAIIAVGMTMVIIAGGIDLSVGSLIALATVVTGILIRDYAGGAQASIVALIACSLAGILMSALIGLFSGAMVTVFKLPPFIATLGVMQAASGLAFILCKGESIYDIPDSYTWLGRGSTFGLPNAVVLMLAIYVAAHILMSRTTLGRRIYAVGGNAEAARLSGVRVGAVLLFVYVMSGAMAGLGGIMMASQLKSADANYGVMYELYVIAAVVVGGTSLSGGEGKIFGTLIGAFIIAVIQNGMNLTGVGSYAQKVVLGLVILGAVLLDRIKKRAG